MLGGLSVPLVWGVVVPPDDYDHWAPKSDGITDAGADMTNLPRPAVVTEDWNGWPAGDAEPRYDMPRTGRVVPHSPAAG